MRPEGWNWTSSELAKRLVTERAKHTGGEIKVAGRYEMMNARTIQY
jgi:hypothetical protein